MVHQKPSGHIHDIWFSFEALAVSSTPLSATTCTLQEFSGHLLLADYSISPPNCSYQSLSSPMLLVMEFASLVQEIGLTYIQLGKQLSVCAI